MYCYFEFTPCFFLVLGLGVSIGPNIVYAAGSGSVFKHVESEFGVPSIQGQGNLNAQKPSNSCMAKFESIYKNKNLTFAYLDALGKPEPGIMTGNLNWPGGFDECLEIKDSKYCTANAKLLNQAKMKALIGVCAPNECSTSDIVIGFNMMINNYGVSNYISLTGATCPKKLEQTSGYKNMIIICGILACFCFIGTILEMLLDLFEPSHHQATNKNKAFMPSYQKLHTNNYKEGNDSFTPSSLEEGGSVHGSSTSSSVEEEYVHKGGVDHKERTILIGKQFTWKNYIGNCTKEFFLCFSLLKNSKVVLSAESPPGAITSVHGIRTISMWWVILGHTFAMGATAGTDNPTQALTILQRVTFLPILNGVYSVDTFFLLSGLLVSYLSLRRFDKDGKLPLVQFYVHRFLRLTPCYLFVILFNTYVYVFLVDSPDWRVVGPGLVEICQKYWWTNILYINNFYPKQLGQECVPVSWYLANDMQFHVISPIILYVMYRFKFLGTVVVNSAICGISFLITALLIAHYNFDVLMMGGDLNNGAVRDPDLSFSSVIYIKPYTRIAPYLIGLVLGYLLHYKMKLRGQWKWIIVACGWCCAIICGLAVVYGTRKTTKAPFEPFTKTENIIYGTFSRFTWGMAVAWVIYACHFGYGGLVNRILSWKAFIPLSRLTFGAYLIHLFVIILYYYTMQSTRHYTDLHIGYEYVSIVGISYMLAYLLAIWIEFPFANLERLVFPTK